MILWIQIRDSRQHYDAKIIRLHGIGTRLRMGGHPDMPNRYAIIGRCSQVFARTYGTFTDLGVCRTRSGEM